jgi:hypothetical protein
MWNEERDMHERRNSDSAVTDERRGRHADATQASWRATVDQRLTGLEDAIGDLRTRVNSVIGLIAAAVVGQVLLRLIGH